VPDGILRFAGKSLICQRRRDQPLPIAPATATEADQQKARYLREGGVLIE
jgi:hypothetical protein